MDVKLMTPLQAIRETCKDCCCGNLKEVRECHIKDCPLWPYRMGKKPQDDKYIDKAELSKKTIG